MRFTPPPPGTYTCVITKQDERFNKTEIDRFNAEIDPHDTSATFTTLREWRAANGVSEDESHRYDLKIFAPDGKEIDRYRTYPSEYPSDIAFEISDSTKGSWAAFIVVAILIVAVIVLAAQ